MSTNAPARMWARYRFHGWLVMVTQSWRDPFGRPMVTIEMIDDQIIDGITDGAEPISESMLETSFLADAVSVDPRSEDGAT